MKRRKSEMEGRENKTEEKEREQDGRSRIKQGERGGRESEMED